MRTLLDTLLATAQQIEGPEGMIAFCQKAADEAAEAVMEASKHKGKGNDEWLEAPHIDGIARKLLVGLVDGQIEVPEDTIFDLCGCSPHTARMYVQDQLKKTWAEMVPGSWLDKPKPEELSKEARVAADEAYRNCLPPITNRRSVQTFVACVAAGVGRRYISTKDANALLYAAQAALAAMPKRRAQRSRKAGAR